MWIARVIATLAFLLNLVGATEAGPRADAAAAYDAGNYTSALQILRPLAEHGDEVAESILGWRIVRATACHRTMRRQCYGIEEQQSRALRRRS